MIIKFKHISISNFLSLGKAELDFNNNGYVLVSGINNCQTDSAKSNGSGKSTIFEAISWVLTGETVRGAKDVVNIRGNDGTVVDIAFDVDSTEYRVLRSKDNSEWKTTLKIWVNGEDKSGKGIRDTSQTLLEYLPDITSSLIGSVIILGQGLPKRFTNNTPSGRKDVLEKLSKSDFMVEDLKERISKRKLLLSDSLRKLEDTLLAYSSKKSTYQQTIESTTHLLNSLGETAEIDKQINNITSVIEDYKNQAEAVKSDIENFNSTVQQYRNDYVAVISEESDEIRKAENEYTTLIQSHIDKKSELLAQIKSLEAEIQRIESIVDICPTCGQKIPNITKPDASPQKAELDAVRAELSRTVEYIDSSAKSHLQCKKGITERFAQQKAEIQQKAEEIKRLVLQSTNKLNSLLNVVSSSTDKKTSLIISKEQFQAKKSSYESTIASTEVLIQEAEKIIDETLKRKEEVQSHLDVINKFYTVITRDFRGYLLKNVIEFISAKAKEYSMEVFDTDKIEFALDGNNISIGYDGKQYENLSGGEKQKVDIIVQFALRDMLCTFLNFGSNILVIDEIFDNLDNVGCAKIIDLISSKLKDISTVYVITHHTDISIPCDSELKVIKDANGISHIEKRG